MHLLHHKYRMKLKQYPDEEKLIAACIKGNARAQRQLYEQYAPGMLGVCMRYTADYATSQDMLQDGFIKVFTKLESFTGEGAFGGWVRRIFVTTCLEFLRQKNALDNAEDISEVVHIGIDGHEDVLDSLTAADLMECVAKLPSGYRTVFNMYAVEGYSHAEIAEELQISENTSRSQFMRARNMLQKFVVEILGEEYVKRFK